MIQCLDSPPTPARSNLVLKIVEKFLEIMQDAYGNYVVHYVLDVCSDDDMHAVCEASSVSLLAIQKFSSNVMESVWKGAQIEFVKHILMSSAKKSVFVS